MIGYTFLRPKRNLQVLQAGLAAELGAHLEDAVGGSRRCPPNH